jgi:hypothetical protein
MFQFLTQWLVVSMYVALVAVFVVPAGWIIFYIVRTHRRGMAENETFLATAMAQRLVPRAPAVLRFRAETATCHAVWLDLDLRGKPSFYDVEVMVTANGVALAHNAIRVRRGDDDGLEWYAGSLGDIALNVRTSLRRHAVVQRILPFTPTPGASIEVRATFTPDNDTTCGPCRVLVTPTPEPGDLNEATLYQGPGLAPLAQALGVVPQGAELKVVCDRFVCVLAPQIDNGVIVGLVVDLSCAPLPHVVFRAETDLDAMAKSAGINAELQTGDAAFDRSVFVDSDAPTEMVAALLARPETRRAVMDLVAQGCRLELGERGIRTLTSGAPDPTRVRHTLNSLAIIAAASPTVSDADRKRYRDGIPLLTTVIWLVVLLLMTVTSAWLLTVFDFVYAALPALMGVVGGVVLAIPFMVATFFVVRRRSDSHRYLMVSWVALALSGPLAGVSLVWAVNCLADTSAPETHAARVVACKTVIYDESTDRLKLAWDDQSTTLKVEDCHPFQGHETVFVTTKAGALGFPWVLKLDPHGDTAAGRRR